MMNPAPASKLRSLLLLLAASVLAASLTGCGREQKQGALSQDTPGRIDRSSNQQLPPDTRPTPQQQRRRAPATTDEAATPKKQADRPTGTEPAATPAQKQETTDKADPHRQASQSDTTAPPPNADTQTSDAPRTSKAPSQQTWPIPEGPLDDEKFVEISAKFAAAVESLSESEKTSENTHAILRTILKQANVTEREYRAYTDRIEQQPERARQIADAIEARVRHRTAKGWEWQPRREPAHQ